ncbi:hypothetical protein SPHINGOAX6_30101 [Sphingomonas sp. AX6]|nr:hypothetical protein SPHINGOAX6_30101 [Sphingomonas sp. AX6]
MPAPAGGSGDGCIPYGDAPLVRTQRPFSDVGYAPRSDGGYLGGDKLRRQSLHAAVARGGKSPGAIASSRPVVLRLGRLVELRFVRRRKRLIWNGKCASE